MKRRLGQQEEVLRWLLASEDPSIRYLTLRHLLEEADDSLRVRQTAAEILEGPRVDALLSGQEADGGFGVPPYQKWKGAHWRLVSLVELGVPPGDSRLTAAAKQVLQWLTGRSHRERVLTINGLTRVHASMEGNALAACSRLGLAERTEVRFLADSLVEWQWPDGGWNCRLELPGRGGGSPLLLLRELGPTLGTHRVSSCYGRWGDPGCGAAERSSIRSG